MVEQLGFCTFKNQQGDNWVVGILVETPRGTVIFNEAMVEQTEIWDYRHLNGFSLNLGILMANEIARLYDLNNGQICKY